MVTGTSTVDAQGGAGTANAVLRLGVQGMTCASCVNRVERFLKAADGVAEAQVNLATESATIRYLPDQTGVAELAGAIAASGYEVPPAALALAGREQAGGCRDRTKVLSAQFSVLSP